MTDTTTDRGTPYAAPVPPQQGHSVWVIVDGDDLPVGPPWADRAAALRHMGTLAAHGARLPLRLFAEDGCPTGDRLP